MKIAIPVSEQKMCMHFGHCELFAFYEVDEKSKTIVSVTELTPPPHEPGVLPKWIKSNGATLVLAGGMGQRAQELFRNDGVSVLVGVVESNPKEAVMKYLNNQLATGENCCDH